MPNDIQKTAMKVLDSLCARTGLLPQSSHIPHHSIKRLGEWPVAHGGFADIWLGLLHGQDVALKMIRLFANDDVEKVRQVVLYHNISNTILITYRFSRANSFIGSDYATQTFFL